jgi:Asp-tRNA(Asn)/Glu-tRNA(Gln) amidotransferase A subunit family amidase
LTSRLPTPLRGKAAHRYIRQQFVFCDRFPRLPLGVGDVRITSPQFYWPPLRRSRQPGSSHRSVFDVSAHKNGKPLGHAKNFLDGWRDAFKTPERDVNLVMGIHGEAAPYLFNDALWERYKLGQQYEVTDGETKSPALRNVFTSAHAAAATLVTPEQTIEALQQRGTKFDLNTPAGDNNQIFSAATGFPAITVPTGFLRGNRLPAGLQLFGRPWSEGELFRLAYSYEQATHHRRPPSADE